MKEIDQDAFNRAMALCDKGIYVFPLNIHVDDWCNGPHLSFEKTLNDVPMTSWYAGRCDRVQNGQTDAVIEVAFAVNDNSICSVSSLENIRVGQMQLTKEYVDKFGKDFVWEDLFLDNTFLEIAVYGSEENTQVRIHKDVKFPAEIQGKVQHWIDALVCKNDPAQINTVQEFRRKVANGSTCWDK